MYCVMIKFPEHNIIIVTDDTVLYHQSVGFLILRDGFSDHHKAEAYADYVSNEIKPS